MKKKLLILATLYSFGIFSQTNLINDGGLENWTNSTNLEFWTIENNVSQNTIDFAEGISSASLSISSNTLIPRIINTAILENGKDYTVSFKLKYLSENFSEQHPIALTLTNSTTNTSQSTFAFFTLQIILGLPKH